MKRFNFVHLTSFKVVHSFGGEFAVYAFASIATVSICISLISYC